MIYLFSHFFVLKHNLFIFQDFLGASNHLKSEVFVSALRHMTWSTILKFSKRLIRFWIRYYIKIIPLNISCTYGHKYKVANLQEYSLPAWKRRRTIFYFWKITLIYLVTACYLILLQGRKWHQNVRRKTNLLGQKEGIVRVHMPQYWQMYKTIFP